MSDRLYHVDVRVELNINASSAEAAEGITRNIIEDGILAFNRQVFRGGTRGYTIHNGTAREVT